MPKFLSLIFIATLLTSCNPLGNDDKSELKLFEVQASDFDAVINNKELPTDPDLTQDKTLLNRDYPIEIAIYQNGKWYYDLPNLDTGTGTWKYENGKIKLYAERDLFDMHIEVVATKEHGATMAIKFADRFGPKVLEVEKVNSEL